ncbi:MAG: lipopolysaccharide biosynthesis protein [Marmoricola sp.]
MLGHDAGSALGFAAVAASFCLYSFARGALYGSGRAIRAAWWNIGTSVLGVVLVGAAVWMNLGAGWVLAVFSLNYFIFAGANWARAKPRLDRGDLGREMDRFTVYGIMGTVASAGFLNAAVVLAAVVGTPTEAGHFSAAFVLATPASLIGGTASLILFPLLSGLRATESEDDRANLVDLSSRTLAVPVVTLFSVLILLRHELIDIVWGSSYEPATSILTPLLFALLLTTLAIPAVNALTTFSARGVRQSAISSASGFMVGAVVWSLFVPAFGVDAVAYGFLAGSGVSSVVPFLITARAIGRSWSRHAAKVGAAIAMLGFASIAQSSLVTGAHADGFILVIYLLFWSFANRTEVLRLTTAGARAFSRSR